MKRLLLSLCLMGAMGLNALADTTQQTITINSVEVTGKQVTAIAFSGDNATLTYSDNTTATESMDVISILLSYDAAKPSAISDVNVFEFNGIVGGNLQVGGLESGTPVQVFSITGKVCATGVAQDGQASIDVSSLGRGLYIVRAGNQAIKFVKK